MQNLIIFGASGHARVIAEAARRSARSNVVGFVDRERPEGDIVDGLTVLGNELHIRSILSKVENVSGIIGIGDNGMREKLSAFLKKEVPTLRFSNVIHPSAVIAKDVHFGHGVFVAASAVINCGSKLGNHVVINTRASVDHDCYIDDFSFIGPGASLAGGISIGRLSFVGTGAAVIPSIKIGDDVIVGAGSAVIRDVISGITVAGVPARQIIHAKATRN